MYHQGAFPIGNNTATNGTGLNSLNRYRNSKGTVDTPHYTISNDDKTLTTPHNNETRSDNARLMMMGENGCSDIGIMDQSCSFDASMLNDVKSQRRNNF